MLHMNMYGKARPASQAFPLFALATAVLDCCYRDSAGARVHATSAARLQLTFIFMAHKLTMPVMPKADCTAVVIPGLVGGASVSSSIGGPASTSSALTGTRQQMNQSGRMQRRDEQASSAAM